MEREDESMLNMLLETIRQELNSIIKEEPDPSLSVKGTPQNVVASTVDDSANTIDTCDTDVKNTVTLLNDQASKTMDEDLKRMQLDLQMSYELFQTIGEKFETMNFGMLKNRIKNLHTSLSANGNDIGNDAIAELKQLFQQSYLDNRLGDLSSQVSEKLHRHPGEFGDIPEVSAFFKACSQLQHGLDNLKRQREQMSDLGKRLCFATESSFDRINEIRKQIDGRDKNEENSPEAEYQLPE